MLVYILIYIYIYVFVCMFTHALMFINNYYVFLKPTIMFLLYNLNEIKKSCLKMPSKNMNKQNMINHKSSMFVLCVYKKSEMHININLKK